MRQRPIRHLAGIFLFIVTATDLFGQPSEKSPGRSTDSHTVRTAYKALSALSSAERKVLYAQFSSELKAAVWRLQLETYLDQHPTLSAGQVAVVHEAIGLLDETLFTISRDDPAWANAVAGPVNALSRRASMLFEHDVLVALFTQLGDSEPSGRNVISTDSANSIRRTPKTLGPPPSTQQDCECSRIDDWCFSGKFCSTAITCRIIGYGCGWFFVQSCDGMCVAVQCC